MATASEALGALLPAPTAEQDAYPAAFRAMAALLLDQATLHVAGVAHRFTELEFYYHGGKHLDDFSHCDPMQRQVGMWYFHRTGGTYRGGTYKGLDITIGRGDAFGGVLIRGIARLDTAERWDGPSVVVDHLLERTGHGSVRALASSFDLRIDEAKGSPLWVALTAGEGRPMFASPRVGLTLKRRDTPARRRFLAMPYRFVSEPARIRKGRVHLVLGLHQEGLAEAEIARITGVKALLVQRYTALYEEARRAPPATWPRDLGTEDLCRLLGACANAMPRHAAPAAPAGGPLGRPRADAPR